MYRIGYVKSRNLLINLVGVARFELATSRPPDARATKLRYTPTYNIQHVIINIH